MRHALRCGSVLSALCQESVGDHSTVRLPQFEATMREFPAGKVLPCPPPVWWCLQKIVLVNDCGIHSDFSRSVATYKTHDARPVAKPLLMKEWMPQ